MGKLVIYYFSGTGNTLYLAKEAARLLDGALIPIVSTSDNEAVCPDTDIFGIVYPVYYNDLPAAVKAFARKLRHIEKKYVFALCNYGGCGGQSLKTLKEIIRSNGGELSAAYGIHMPQNAFKKPWVNNKRLINKSVSKIGKLAAAVKAGKRVVYKNSLLDKVLIHIHESLVIKVKASLAGYSGLTAETELDALIHSADRCFQATGNCTGCGLCVRVCPAGNIKLKDGRPVWLGRCENCLACFDWCPSKAIKGALVAKDYYYTNPEITASEIMAQQLSRNKASKA